MDPDDIPLNIDWIVELVIWSDDAVPNCVPAFATTEGSSPEESDGMIDPNGWPLSIDWIIESAIWAGDAVVDGFFAASANSDVG